MNLSCPHTQVSYGTWKLQLLRRLCAGTQSDNSPALPFLRPRVIASNQHDRRDFHNSTRQSRSNIKDVKRSAKFKATRSDINTSNQGSEESSSEASVLKRKRGSKGDPNRRQSANEWNPYSEDGLAEMQDLVGSLRVMADHAKEKETKGKAINNDDIVPFEHGSRVWARKTPHLPESPLERILPWKREKKLQVQEVEPDKRLENNIWAQMLASPLRLDRGTKARLPRDLMVRWGVMQNPSNDKNYLLPVDLSDLEALRSELEAIGKPTEERISIDEGRGERDANINKPRPPPRVVISPNRLLLEAVIEDLMHEKPSPGRNKPSVTVTNSPKLNASLIPFRWRYKQDEFEAFRRKRQKFNETLGREPDADEPNPTDMAKLDKLQWQPDISIRINNIIRKRVLITLEAVGRDNASGRAVHDRRIQGLFIPKSGRIYVNEGHTFSEDQSLSPSPRPKEVDRDALHEQSIVPTWLHGAICLYVGDARGYRETMERWHRSEELLHSTGDGKLERLSDNNLLPPMITINDRFRLPVFNLEALFGEEHGSEIRKTLQDNKTWTFDYWNQDTHQTHQNQTPSSSDVAEDTVIPSSPLDAGEQVLSSILTRAPDPAATAPTPVPTSAPDLDSSVGINAEGKQTRPYLLLIKPRAKHASVLAKELWQYWRYVGGRSGLQLE